MTLPEQHIIGTLAAMLGPGVGKSQNTIAVWRLVEPTRQHRLKDAPRLIQWRTPTLTGNHEHAADAARLGVAQERIQRHMGVVAPSAVQVEPRLDGKLTALQALTEAAVDTVKLAGQKAVMIDPRPIDQGFVDQPRDVLRCRLRFVLLSGFGLPSCRCLLGLGAVDLATGQRRYGLGDAPPQAKIFFA